MGRSRSHSRSRSRSRGRRDSRSRRSRSRSRSSSEDSRGYRIHVADLGIDCSKQEIEHTFERFGPLMEVWLARNPPCFAFVVYRHKEDAEEAIRDMNGKTLCGGRVRVSMALPRTRGRRRRGFDPNLRCYQCGERGHFSRDCNEIWRYRSRRPSPRPSRRHSRSRSRDRRRSRSRERRRSRSRDRRSRSRSRERRSRSRDRNSRSRDRKSKSRERRSKSRERKSSKKYRSRSKERRSRSKERRSRSKDQRSRSKERRSRSKERRSRSKEPRSRSKERRSPSEDRQSRSKSQSPEIDGGSRSRDSTPGETNDKSPSPTHSDKRSDTNASEQKIGRDRKDSHRSDRSNHQETVVKTQPSEGSPENAFGNGFDDIDEEAILAANLANDTGSEPPSP